MAIDVHNHYLPEPFVNQLLEWDTTVGIEEEAGELYMLHELSGAASGGGNRIKMEPGFTDLDARRQWKDENEIDLTIVGVSTPNPIAEAFTVKQSNTLIQAINDGYHADQRDYPDLIAGLGMLPLRDPEAAVEEVERVVNDLDLVGFSLPTSVNGEKLSAPELAPAFEAIDDSGMPIVFHPHGNALARTLDEEETFLSPIMVFPMETAFQIGRLIYDGFFDRYDFDVVLPHMGGVILPLAGRLDRGRREMGNPDVPPTKPVVNYLQEFYYDVISFHPPALETAVDTVGVEHLMWGTDYAFDMEDLGTSMGHLEAAVPRPDNREKVLTGNAEAVFDL